MAFSGLALSALFSPSCGGYRRGFWGQREHLMDTEAMDVLPSQLCAGHCLRDPKGHFLTLQERTRRPSRPSSMSRLSPARGSRSSSAQASSPAFIVKCPLCWVHGPQKRTYRLSLLQKLPVCIGAGRGGTQCPG